VSSSPVSIPISSLTRLGMTICPFSLTRTVSSMFYSVCCCLTSRLSILLSYLLLELHPADLIVSWLGSLTESSRYVSEMRRSCLAV